MIQSIKRTMRPVYLLVLQNRLYRWLRTRGYSSGRIALGEKNRYGTSGDWITVDMEGADFNIEFDEHTRLPFADNSQSAIYSSHLVEHLDDPVLMSLFRECFRVLRTGGYLRLETPDAEKIVDSYKKKDAKFLRFFAEENRKNLVEERGFSSIYGAEYIGVLGLLSCYIIDDRHVPALAAKEEFDKNINTLSLEDFGKWCVALQTPEQRRTHGHVNTIFFNKLHRMLSQADFNDITCHGNRESRIINIDSIERKQRAFYSLCVEARK